MHGQSLVLLHVYNNTLTGFGAESFNGASLNSLLLSTNLFATQLPLLSTPQLKFLSLAGNQFYGKIPPSYAHQTRLRQLSLSQNRLSGTIPKALLQQCLDLRVVQLSSNRLYGKLPSFETNYLEELDLRNNLFSGHVPPQLSKHGFIPKLGLSLNHLSCALPKGKHVNLTFNKNMHQALDVLDGNLFGCPIPGMVQSFDDSAAFYQCGYRSFEVPVAIACLCAVCMLLMRCWFWFWDGRLSEEVESGGSGEGGGMASDTKQQMAINKSVPSEWTSFLQGCYAHTLWCTIVLSLFAMFVLVPGYASAPSDYACRYSLVITAAFVRLSKNSKSGIDANGWLLSEAGGILLLIGAGIFTCVLLVWNIRQQRMRLEKNKRGLSTSSRCALLIQLGARDGGTNSSRSHGCDCGEACTCACWLAAKQAALDEVVKRIHAHVHSTDKATRWLFVLPKLGSTTSNKSSTHNLGVELSPLFPRSINCSAMDAYESGLVQAVIIACSSVKSAQMLQLRLRQKFIIRSGGSRCFSPERSVVAVEAPPPSALLWDHLDIQIPNASCKCQQQGQQLQHCHNLQQRGRSARRPNSQLLRFIPRQLYLCVWVTIAVSLTALPNAGIVLVTAASSTATLTPGCKGGVVGLLTLVKVKYYTSVGLLSLCTAVAGCM
jgi:hypothetical protein